MLRFLETFQSLDVLKFERVLFESSSKERDLKYSSKQELMRFQERTLVMPVTNMQQDPILGLSCCFINLIFKCPSKTISGYKWINV